MTINLLPFYEDIAVMRSYTIVEITYFDFKLRSFNGTRIYMYTMYRRYGSIKHNIEHYSEIDPDLISYMPELQCRIRSRIRSRVKQLPHIIKPYEISHWQSNDF